MRTFIISLIILGLCLGGCFVNAFFTRHKIGKALDTLSTVKQEEIGKFSRDWAESSGWLTFTVKRTFLRDIADALQRLEAAAKHNDEYEFEAAKAALIYKMKELYRSQSFDIKTIL